eukprot:5951123-Prymnesium_polylepis.1
MSLFVPRKVTCSSIQRSTALFSSHYSIQPLHHPSGGIPTSLKSVAVRCLGNLPLRWENAR